MNESQPFLLVRARPRPEAAERLTAWFRESHLRDVRRIPGIVQTEWGRLAGGTLLGLYSFESADVVGAALASPQAAYARGTWERWASDLEELSIEIFAPLIPLPIYQSAS